MVSVLAKNEVMNNFPPRFQWTENMGYCGEVSLVTAGLAFGQYLSQYDSRIASCPTLPQNKCEMLLGVNDESAASKMHFGYSEWNTIKVSSFLRLFFYSLVFILSGFLSLPFSGKINK
jgi:hypothetical protein